MIISDHKRAAATIVGRMQDGKISHGGEVKDEMEMDSGMQSHAALAGEILQAIESKSPHELMQALKAFIAECEQYEE